MQQQQKPFHKPVTPPQSIEHINPENAIHAEAGTSTNSLMMLQRTIGNQAVMRMLSRQPIGHPSIVQRSPKTDAPKAPVNEGDKFDAGEAASLVDQRLFDSDGYFAVLRERLKDFQKDMTTELGWYAGDKKEDDKKGSPISENAVKIIKDKAKEAGKKGVSTLLEVLTKGALGTGVPGVAATFLAGIVEDVLGKDDYNPVVLQIALKKPHQVFIEGLLKVLSEQQDALRVRWIKGRSEAIKNVGVDGLLKYAEQIKTASDTARLRFYPELVGHYMSVAPERTASFETPHSKYTGEKQGVVDFFGKGAGAHYASKFQNGDIYVEVDMSAGYHTGSMKIKKTVIPELPRDVMQQLNDPQLPDNMGVGWGTLPFKRIIIEGGSSSFPLRVVWEKGGQILPASTPSFSKQICIEISKAHGDYANVRSGIEGYSTGELGGASLLGTFVITQPLKKMNFAT